MDDISREFPAEADGPQSRPRRSKGPAELSRLEGEDEELGGGLEGEPAVNRVFGDGSGGAGRELPRSVDSQPGQGQPGEREPGWDAASEAAAGAAGDDAGGDAADDAGGDAAELDQEPVDPEAARRAVAAEADALELEDEEPLDELDAEDGLPAVPELSDPGAVARVLFVLMLTQPGGLSVLRLAQACNTTQKLIEQGLEVLRDQLLAFGAPAELLRTGDTVKLVSTPDAFAYLERLRGVKRREKLSPAALETLAVIAYRQPVIRAEIEAIRGVKAGPMLRTLLQHKLVRITGRADVPGRPLQYGTTEHFLERFGLASLQELPSLKEFKQLG